MESEKKHKEEKKGERNRDLKMCVKFEIWKLKRERGFMLISKKCLDLGGDESLFTSFMIGLKETEEQV